MSISIFGVRHHGPGCARSLRTALEQLEPDIILVEGPPDARNVLPLLASQDMRPPVALLIYAPDNPKRAVYYPFTTFSPEWQALQYAFLRGIPARFMDLPQAIQLAKEPDHLSAEIPPVEKTPSPEDADTTRIAQVTVEAEPTEKEVNEPVQKMRDDPLAMLAEAAGYDDHELWWEQQIEQRIDSAHLFEGILEAMTALRSDLTPANEEEALREAHMRQSIRAAQKEGFQRIAVVCGAWHTPALSDMGIARADATLLSGLKRVKVEATWIPWTNSRLAYRSGYGAGVSSPGWYEHLWTASDRISIRWLTRAAHLLRQEGFDTSSAHVIEAVRLGDTLAALRDLPMPGMTELHEAILTVLCGGNASPLALIRDKLEVGEKLGEVPAETPAVPLQRDLEARQRRLRLKPTASVESLELDLRNETDQARSKLLHQLRLLGIEWGTLQRVSGAKRGSFHEHWQLQWKVEFILALIEANVWGNTLETASTTFVCHQADTLQDLPALTELLDKTILAELPHAIDYLLTSVQKRAALSVDIQHLMNALPPLARVVRYGNVRQTRAEQILPVFDGLFQRVVVGLHGACTSLDDEAAQGMVQSINYVQESVNLLNRKEQQSVWQQVMRQLILGDSIHGLVRGRCCRLLLEQNVLNEEELQQLAGLALSPVNGAPQAAAWVQGVLQGSGLQVLHLNGLWLALDTWLSELSEDVFVALLPLLRRAFADFHAPERQKMGEKVKQLRNQPRVRSNTEGHDNGFAQRLDEARAAKVLPVLAQILGVKTDGIE